jgi:hypothetical protein
MKKFSKFLTSEDMLDITLEIKKKQIKKFALNYRALIKNKWEQIYRVDNFHGFLHEQRFWRTKEPIPIEDSLPNSIIINKYVDYIIENFQKFKEYFKRK